MIEFIMTIPYIRIIVGPILIYFFILLALKFLGKKEFAQLTITDLILILLLGNSLQSAMIGSDSSFIGGILAASSLLLTNYLFKWFLYLFPKFSKVVQGEPIVLIYKGQVNDINLNKIQMTLDELKESIRAHGIFSTSEVDLAIFEVNGTVSVLTGEFRSSQSNV